MQTPHPRPQGLGKQLPKLILFPLSPVQFSFRLYSLPLLGEKSKDLICVVVVHRAHLINGPHCTVCYINLAVTQCYFYQ